MNKKQVKKLRQIVGSLDNPISRRVYRRLKKQFNKVPQDSKAMFIEMSRETLNGKQ
jgi:hypothetical protein